MIGVLADDTTGANDVGVAFQIGGAGVKVIAFEEETVITPDEDVMVIDTNSRLDGPEIAYKKVATATRQLMQAGCTQFYKKACSTLRGNVGAEFDAVLDATGLNTMIVSVAFPENERATINGQHYVHGVLLENSNFRDDPVHPMTTSNLGQIIGMQSSRKAVVVPLSEVRKGPSALRDYLKTLRDDFSYLLIDGETREDIAVLATAAFDYPVFGGSSALGQDLPKHLGKFNGPAAIDREALVGSGASLIVCGSLTPQTIEQTSQFLTTGASNFEFHSVDIFNPEYCTKWLSSVIPSARKFLESGKDVLLYASQKPETVAATKLLAKNHKLDDAQLGKKISALLGEAAYGILKDTPPYPLIVAGGDTSAAVCGKLGIHGNRIIEEIDPGVPLGQTLTIPRLIVLKSGGFGKPDFLIRASRRIREISQSSVVEQ